MLEALINHFTDGNKARFAAMVGVSPQTISKWIARNTFDAEALYANCDGVSASWLLSGNGDMLENNYQHGNTQIGNPELLNLCCELVANYRQRDAVMAKLVEILG